LILKKILIYGYGNPGRQDDGLGKHLVELIDEWKEKEEIKNIHTDCNYQLNIEDAATIAGYDTVIFADASVEEMDDFKLEKVTPDNSTIEFTMHAVSVSFVLDLCQKLYNRQPETVLLHIRAYEFEFIEKLTSGAEKNLMKAFEFLIRFLTNQQKEN